MRRLARWLLNATTLLSLILCVALAIAWARTASTGRRSLGHVGIEPQRLRVVLWCASVGDGRVQILRFAESYWDRAGFDL